MNALTENEIAREARRVLRKLIPAQAKLVRSDASRWTVVRRGAARSGRLRVDGRAVTAFCARGWLEPAADSEDALRLSDAGRNWMTAEAAGIDRFQAQHSVLGSRLIRDPAGGVVRVTVNEGESPLGWLKARRGIGDAQFAAGERLRRDYTLGQLQPRLCSDLTAPVVCGRRGATPETISDVALAARQRFARAMKAVGPGLSDLLFDVCCDLRGIETVESDKGWPRRSAKVVLGLALDRLADHYGFRRAPPPSHLRSWSAEFETAAQA